MIFFNPGSAVYPTFRYPYFVDLRDYTHGIDVWMRKLSYVTYRTGEIGNNPGERYSGPQPVYNKRSSG